MEIKLDKNTKETIEYGMFVVLAVVLFVAFAASGIYILTIS